MLVWSRTSPSNRTWRRSCAPRCRMLSIMSSCASAASSTCGQDGLNLSPSLTAINRSRLRASSAHFLQDLGGGDPSVIAEEQLVAVLDQHLQGPHPLRLALMLGRWSRSLHDWRTCPRHHQPQAVSWTLAAPARTSPPPGPSLTPRPTSARAYPNPRAKAKFSAEYRWGRRGEAAELEQRQVGQDGQRCRQADGQQERLPDPPAERPRRRMRTPGTYHPEDHRYCRSCSIHRRSSRPCWSPNDLPRSLACCTT